jgi:hypothetical protein
LPILLSLPLAAACSRGSGSDAPDATGVEPDAEDGPDGMLPEGASRVYAHSGTNLYRIETSNLDVVLVGPFGAALGNASMTDIAVDKDDHMVGVSLGDIYSINADTGAATLLVEFQGEGSLSSLSYVPVDPAAPDGAERLVTATDAGDVYEINPQSGAATLLGNYGMSNGEIIRSSGDIVSVRGLGTLATVTIGLPFTNEDFLATIDTTTWAATIIGTEGTGYDKIFGLGYWGGTIFGFVDNAPGATTGSLITIDPVTGIGTPAQVSNFRWYGAGVTTNAPIVD